MKRRRAPRKSQAAPRALSDRRAGSDSEDEYVYGGFVPPGGLIWGVAQAEPNAGLAGDAAGKLTRTMCRAAAGHRGLGSNEPARGEEKRLPATPCLGPGLTALQSQRHPALRKAWGRLSYVTTTELATMSTSLGVPLATMGYTRTEGSSGFSPASFPGLVSAVSGRLALALVSLQAYLSTFVSTVKKITQKRSGLFMILCLIFVAALAGAYCGTSLPVRVLWAKKVPQVLLEQPVGQLKAMWNAVALLNEQQQEVQELRKEMACLVAQMSRVKKELEDMRMAMSAMPLEENVQMSAWALKSTGVTIDLQASPRSYAWPCSVFWFLCDLNRPSTFAQMDDSSGYCWPFQASRSQLVIRLPARVQPTAITVQHPLKESSAFGDISSAPRDFTVSVSLCRALGAGTECWGKAVRGTC
ncbi:uncharacterized protein LOC142027125 [Buteo buteo]|uniref:uncharacterized protein LOC142027125 n=1 Tax=Buteo buteo TaxID=30397 RepID=UPI003EBE0610